MLLISCTSGRAEAFARLVKYVEAQSYDNYTWLVVTDDWEGYKFPKKAKVVKREAEGDTLPSLCHNLLTALDHPLLTEHEKCVILEDDDWYHKMYLYEMNKLLDKGDLAGFNEDAYYYVLSRRACRRHNQDHASLAATGFRTTIAPLLKEICLQGDVFIDGHLWSTYRGRKALAHNFTGILKNSREAAKLDKNGDIINEFPRHVGLKEPWHGGKLGLSEQGHTAAGGFDQGAKTLRKWLGDEADFYLKFTRDFDLKNPPMGVMINLPMTTTEV